MKITSHCESHFDNYEYGTWPFHVASFCCRMFGCFAPATLIKMIQSGLIRPYFVLGKWLAPVALIGKMIQSGFGGEDNIEDKSIVQYVWDLICLWENMLMSCEAFCGSWLWASKNDPLRWVHLQFWAL